MISETINTATHTHVNQCLVFMKPVVALLPDGVKSEMRCGAKKWCPRRELNADTRIRNPLLYPFELREPRWPQK
jgi:hypothetical protein